MAAPVRSTDDLATRSPGGRSRPFPVLLGAVLASRPACFGLLSGGLVLLLLHGAGLSWHCPMRALTGIPCPGCGMTRAVSCLLAGRWSEAVRLNAFVVPLAVGTVLLSVGTVAPSAWRAGLARWVSHVEARTGITSAVGVAYILFGIVRVVLTLLERAGWR